MDVPGFPNAPPDLSVSERKLIDSLDGKVETICAVTREWNRMNVLGRSGLFIPFWPFELVLPLRERLYEASFDTRSGESITLVDTDTTYGLLSWSLRNVVPYFFRVENDFNRRYMEMLDYNKSTMRENDEGLQYVLQLP